MTIWIEKIKLVNFRNHQLLEQKFEKYTNIIIGDNGVGKTSILEAIFFLVNKKSHRTIYVENIINKESEVAYLEATVCRDGLKRKVNVELKKTSKIVKLGGKTNKEVATVIFEPNDLELIKGEPAIRRKYLDEQISQISEMYKKTIIYYEKVLKERNFLLKEMQKGNSKNEKLLEVLSEKLVEKAIPIYQMRKNFVDNINENIESIFYDITGLDGLIINYDKKIDFFDFKTETIKEKLIKNFKFNHNEEITKGMTLIGPHRDDVVFNIKNNNLKDHGSQGQQRATIVALKLSEIGIIKKINKTNPIVLLDDIFSELDGERRNKLLSYLDKDMQIIITATDIESINKELREKSKIIKLNEEVKYGKNSL